MKVHININLCATLRKFVPECAETYPIERGITVGGLLEHLGVPQDDVKFIFISGRRGDVSSALYGGERVTIFPIVGGG
jgi:molybdopterin synthase sulfur carrier subunit